MSEPAVTLPDPYARNPEHFFNRELSWLKFNSRVLQEALDESNPLLERLKFLAIFSTNLDEFIMIRYAGLKEQSDAGINKRSADGKTADEQIELISDTLHKSVLEHRRILGKVVLPALAKKGVKLVPIADLNQSETKAVKAFFHSEFEFYVFA